MQERYIKHYSHHLGADNEMLIFGHWGYPVIVFPTTMGRYYEAKDFGLIQSAEGLLRAGKIKIFCPDTIDHFSWYAKHLHPAERIQNHHYFDQYLLDELIPLIQHECNVAKVAVAGCSFGGYHAANFAFKHPDKVSHLFTMGAAFDIRSFLNGFYNDLVYFNNPPDYLPNLQHPDLWQMHIVLGTCIADFCKPETERLSGILSQKHVSHWLDVRPHGTHDWATWKEMFPSYLSQL